MAGYFLAAQFASAPFKAEVMQVRVDTRRKQGITPTTKISLRHATNGYSNAALSHRQGSVSLSAFAEAPR